MTCSACSSGLEKYLKKQKGIKEVSVNLVLSLVTIEYENITVKEIEQYIKEAGFQSLGELKGNSFEEKQKTEKPKLCLYGILLSIILILNIGHMLKYPFFLPQNFLLIPTIILILTIFFLWYGFDLLKNGTLNLLHKIPNMDTLVLLSVSFSFLYSCYGYINLLFGNYEHLTNLYFESTCMIIYFIKLGRYIENQSKEKTKEAIKKLVIITPQNARLKIKDQEKVVPIDEVKKEDILIGKAGDKIAVDGIVLNGKTYVDETFITGESLPILKNPNDHVIAGSMIYDGYIEYQAQKIGKETTISEIVKLIIEATSTKNKIQKLVDRISGYFVPFIIIISMITFFLQITLSHSFEKSLIYMISVLVVACPCALGLAVPLVIVVTNGICAEKGLFLKNGDVLENARNIDTIVLDKTGTLTFGKLKVAKMINFSKYNEEELFSIISSIEKHSSHPISTALKGKEKYLVNNFKTLNGLGVSGEINSQKYYLGNAKLLEKYKIKNTKQKEAEQLIESGCSIIYVVEKNQIIGLVGVRDIIRKDMKNTIKKFYKKNLEVIMLTGDHSKNAEKIAEELGISKVIANVLPKDKTNVIQKMIQEGKKVIMVGDGINDAPALVNATIGISMNEGTDVAMDAADVILMNNDLKNILDLITISKRSYQVIKQNLFWAFLYNVCMIPIAMGLFSNLNITLTPGLGSIAMILSSLTVVLNSLRYGRGKL